MRDHWIRAEAEAQNIRARGEREVDETRQFAVQKFAKDVVEAAENLRRGFASLPAQAPRAGDHDQAARRVRGCGAQFVALLERNAIVADDPVGKPFNADLTRRWPSSRVPSMRRARWYSPGAGRGH